MSIFIVTRGKRAHFFKNLFFGDFIVIWHKCILRKIKVQVLTVILICVPKKSTNPRSRQKGVKIPPPLKTALWKTRENGPRFLKIKNEFLFVRITISDHHMNSTIVFFILCAKNLKKQHITTNYNLIIFPCFLRPS